MLLWIGRHSLRSYSLHMWPACAPCSSDACLQGPVLLLTCTFVCVLQPTSACVPGDQIFPQLLVPCQRLRLFALQRGLRQRVWPCAAATKPFVWLLQDVTLCLCVASVCMCGCKCVCGLCGCSWPVWWQWMAHHTYVVTSCGCVCSLPAGPP